MRLQPKSEWKASYGLMFIFVFYFYVANVATNPTYLRRMQYCWLAATSL